VSTIIGWDIGGAHLKAARVENGTITRVAQLPSPLWLGVDKLEAAFASATGKVGTSRRHVVTMTGELADVFASRAEGVQRLARIASHYLAASDITFYAGPAGFLALDQLTRHVPQIASANWHASARWAAHLVREGLFLDMGSTTTDLVGFENGAVTACGYTDAERLAAGELVYTGLVRSFLMSVAASVPFRGQSMPLMNEYFANTADIYRILGELPSGADQQATADGREKSAAASKARLARMLGLDVSDAPEAAWTEVAHVFREAQLRKLHDAASLILSRRHLPTDAPIVGAGIGTKIIRELARRLRRPYAPFARLVGAASPAIRRSASDCAPAASVALLAQSLSPSHRCESG
jgi:probable H4MPT-linked C1 transfer pathway protein